MKLNKETKVFVSGGAGVIGKELVSKLLKKGCQIFVGDLKPQPSEWRGKLRYREGDLNTLTSEEVLSFQPDVFIHLAATFERSAETYGFWEENFYHNTSLSHHLMTLLKDIKCLKKVIFASSYLVYNPTLYLSDSCPKHAYRIKETDEIFPRNLTGTSKLFHEIELGFLQNFQNDKNDKCKFISARIFRGYGKGSRDIISRWIRSLINGQEIEVYRKENLFDFIYAEDSAEGLIRLAESPIAEGIVNLGTGQSRSISHVIDVLSKYFPNLKCREIDVKIPYEASEADVELLHKYTNWLPYYSLELAIPKIIDYEQEVAKNHDLNDIRTNILVTSVSKKTPLISSLSKSKLKISDKIKIIGADSNAHCISRQFTDEFWNIPKIDQLNLEHVISYCRLHGIKAIIPTRDAELVFWAKHKDALKAEGINVMVSDLSVVEMCTDKLRFANEMMQYGFPAIPTSTELADIKSSSYVVKERFGAGSRSILLNSTKEVALEHALKLAHPVFQPYIKGEEFSVDIYVEKSGKVKGCIVRRRELVIDGESQITSTCRLPNIEELCIQIAEKFPFYGHILFQVILSEDNAVNIIECNPRFGGASTLSIAAGLDSFYWFLLESMGESLGKVPFMRSSTEKRQIRYAADVVIDIEKTSIHS